jgi:S-adenosylmethionine:tRNA ribosyltransferase-isomerase
MNLVATVPRRTQRPSLSVRLNDFGFEYPRELVARYPVEPRDASRMMVLNREHRTIEHRQFRDIVEYFDSGDVMVVNDTRVFPARLFGNKEKTGARVEVFLLRELNSESRLWDVIVNPARKIRVGNKLYFDSGLVAEVIDNTTSRGRTIRFIYEGSCEDLYREIDQIGTTPIPHYLRRPTEPEDAERYQTVFAMKRGAVAAPTSALHFTPAIVDAIRARGVHIAPVTLHIGLGTFRPVEVEDLTKHQMDSECFEVTQETCDAVNCALLSRQHSVTAVGTAAARAVESSISAMGLLKPGKGWTDKFIFPPYQFRVTQRLLTNFQMPHSTLLMLVSAFGDREFVLHAYEEAIREEYRLFSFCDAMLSI